MLQVGEVVLIRMQFHQAPGSKIRPALVCLDTGDDDFVAAPITSQAKLSEYDLAIRDWRAAGLNVASLPGSGWWEVGGGTTKPALPATHHLSPTPRIFCSANAG